MILFITWLSACISHPILKETSLIHCRSKVWNFTIKWISYHFTVFRDPIEPYWNIWSNFIFLVFFLAQWERGGDSHTKMMGVVIRNFEKNLRGVLSSCTSSQEPLQMTKIYTQANQWLLNKERITMVISLWTGTPGQNPKRYQDPVLWAWPESFSPLRSINSKTTHYLLPYFFWLR